MTEGCPHGKWLVHDGETIKPPSCDCEPTKVEVVAARDALPVANISGVRLAWLEALADAVADKDGEFTTTDLFLAHVFTRGHFDYSTGDGTVHQTVSRLLERSGLGSKATVQKFLKRCRDHGFLEVMPGRERVLGEGRATPLYRLTLPS